MKYSQLLRHSPDWMTHEGPEHDIVITSRVRLARNLRGVSFPGWARKEERVMIMQGLQPRVEALPQMAECYSEDLGGLDAIRKQVLVEKHLISREQAAKASGSAAVINKEQTLSIMINEEDHLRMQSIRSGLDLRNAHAALDAVDAGLEQMVNFAWDENYGYLTACPTNLGTGMRASAMLHLPGLVLCEEMSQVIAGVNKLGLAVRGLYGEGTEALANLFQVSNQHTLGESEQEIIAKLERLIQQIVQHERNARLRLMSKRPEKVRDHVGRAFATLKYAHILESKEALTHLSMLRMGCDMALLPTRHARLIDNLLVEIQPAHLQMNSHRKLNPEERDILRATLLRERLAEVNELSVAPPEGGGKDQLL